MQFNANLSSTSFKWRWNSFHHYERVNDPTVSEINRKAIDKHLLFSSKATELIKSNIKRKFCRNVNRRSAERKMNPRWINLRREIDLKPLLRVGINQTDKAKKNFRGKWIFVCREVRQSVCHLLKEITSWSLSRVPKSFLRSQFCVQTLKETGSICTQLPKVADAPVFPWKLKSFSILSSMT